MNHYKQALALLLFTTLLSSCCVFSSRECDCDPPKPYINNNAIVWIPVDSADVYFESEDSTLTRRYFANYAHRNEYVGGEECGTEFEAFSNSLESNTGDVLLYCHALMDRVDFQTSVKATGKTTYISSFNADNNEFSNEGYFQITRSDSIANGLKIPRVTFRKLDATNTSIPFLKMTILQGSGVVNFIDNSGTSWHRK